MLGLCRGGQQAFDVLGGDVDLEVDEVSDSLWPKVVRASVVGMSETVKPVSSTDATVR